QCSRFTDHRRCSSANSSGQQGGRSRAPRRPGKRNPRQSHRLPVHAIGAAGIAITVSDFNQPRGCEFSIDRALADNPPINFARVVIYSSRFLLFGVGIELLFFLPALIDATQTPFGAPPRSADWLTANSYKHRISVSVWIKS